MDRLSFSQIKKFAQFHDECRRFDRVLEQLQDRVYPTAHENEEDFAVYVSAQLVRDYLFRLVRKTHGIPNEESPDEFDCGGGEVVRSG